MRPFIRFWNRLSYRRWLTLEDSVRLGRGMSGEFNFTAGEQKSFPKEWKLFPRATQQPWPGPYDFSRHRLVLDLGGGTGSFLRAISERYPELEGTLYELPQAAAIARQKLTHAGGEHKVTILEGDFLKDPLPMDHDAFLIANVMYVLVPE